jgi:hypothetical protein
MTPPEHDAEDPHAFLRARIEETREAAEQLAGEAASARAQEEPPPGWATTDDGEARTSEVHALVALLETLKDLLPDELREQFRELLRQVLLLVRALIDWWVDRIETHPAAGGPSAPGNRVQDIPIA